MAAILPTLTASTVLGKRKASEQSAYVLHLASSPEPDCSRPTTSKPVLINGKLTSSRKIYQCTHAGCEKAYLKPSRLEEHERTHTGERPFVCSICNKSYLRESNLQAHSRSHQPESARPLACTFSGCQKRFWTSQHLHVHLNWHNGLKSIKCTSEGCTEEFTKHTQLRNHIASAHSPPGTKPYRCENQDCGKSFSTNQHLHSHMKTHDSKRYMCGDPQCLGGTPTFYATWTQLQHHARTAHPPTCHYSSCNGRTFTSRHGLRGHLKLHEEQEVEAQVASVGEEAEPPKKRRRGGELGRGWKCEICGKEFKSKKAQNTHTNIVHLGRRDFVCPHENCQEDFGYKHLLQRHIAKCHSTHSEEEKDGSSEDDESAVTPDIDIDTITGRTYAIEADKKLKTCKALRCPFPDMSGIQLSVEFTGGGLGCEYVFSRAYDLCRHLRATHRIDANRDSVGEWVQAKKKGQSATTGV